MRTTALLLSLALTASLLAACSGTRLIYERLDWYAKWRTSDYVSFKPQQATLFNQRFDQLWRWHRQQELPRYANDLREIADALNKTATVNDVERFTQRFRGHWERALARTVSDFCAVTKTLDDAQVKSILKGVEEDNREYAKENAEPSPEGRREIQQKRAEKWIKRWAGSMSAEQKKLAQRWASERRDTAARWVDYRQDWRVAFEQALNQRVASPRCEPMQPLFVSPMKMRDETLDSDMVFNEALWRKFVVDIATTLSDKQRVHAQKELRDLARQFDELAVAAAQPSPSTKTSAKPAG